MQHVKIDENRAGTKHNDVHDFVAVVLGPNSPDIERFAAQELCAYLEKLFGIHTEPVIASSSEAEVLFLIGSPETNDAVKEATAGDFPELTDQGLVLRNSELAGSPCVIVGGGSPRATLWAVYELVERWGVQYLSDRDVLPEKKQFELPDLDVVMEPLLRIRMHPTFQDFAASGESWGLADFARLMDQLAKMKFTRMQISMYGWQPYLHWQHKGIERSTASLWYDYHYPISSDMIGRELFGDETEFWNRDLPLTSNYKELVAAGEQLFHNVMAHAHSRGLECALSAPLIDFPTEFAPLLEGAERSHVLGGMTIVPGSQTPLDDPALSELASAVLHAVVNTYPEADLVTVWMPEYRQWTAEYEYVWKSLDERYGISQAVALEDALAAASRRPDFPGDPERGPNEVKGDLASLYFYERLLRDSAPLKDTCRPDMKFIYSNLVEELYPILDHILPHDWEMEVMPSNQPSILLERIEVLKTLPKNIAGILCLTIDDDNIGVMPQLTTNSLHKIIQVMKRHGWTGFMARERYPGDHDWPLAYLARAAWDDAITPDEVARQQVGAICGEACVEDMLSAFHEVEAATITLCVTNFAFPADWPPTTATSFGGMFMKHWEAGPAPEVFVQGHLAYKRALEFARRAQSQSTEAGRWYTDFWVGRLEFAERYMESTLALRRTATAHEGGDRPAYLQHADDALEAMKAALEAYARVARNQTDRGAIATVNEHCYREMRVRNWSLHAHGY